MLKLPTSDPEEGEVRATVPHEVPALSPTVRAGRQIPITCISVLAVVSAAVAASFIYLKPWSFELPAASPYMGFQEKEMQCHDSCHVHDVANSHCLQDCLPAKQQCISSKCGADVSTKFSSCALDCHSSECEAKCSSAGERASRCHLACAPDFRTLKEDPVCVKNCKAQHDDSCMAGCAEPTKRCLNQRCIGNNKQEYSACQSDCELQSCGSECQEANRAFAECSSHCYPESPSGSAAMFVPPSVKAASEVFLRMSHCKKQCREHDDRHFQCMHLCGPKITKCMQQTCPDAVPESDLQKSCMDSCEKTTCGDLCYNTFKQAKVCYKDACHPGDATSCGNACHEKHDDGCMTKCGFELGGCIATKCSLLLNEDHEGYAQCEKECMESHCGHDCAQRSISFRACSESCDQAATM